MKKSGLIKIVLSIIATVILSKIAFNYVIAYISSFSINPDTINTHPDYINTKVLYSVFVFCFLYIFMMISIPFILSTFAEKWNINRENWLKIILGLEIFALIFAYWGTPPDLISTILLFILFQIPVLINFISLFRITKN